MNGRTKDAILILRALRATCYHPARHLDTLSSSAFIRKQNPVNKKAGMGTNPQEIQSKSKLKNTSHKRTQQSGHHKYTNKIKHYKLKRCHLPQIH
jgi:hypothetical protein